MRAEIELAVRAVVALVSFLYDDEKTEQCYDDNDANNEEFDESWREKWFFLGVLAFDGNRIKISFIIHIDIILT